MWTDHRDIPQHWMMGFQTRFLSEPLFKLWILDLALGIPQIQQLLPLIGILVFLSVISSNFFCFDVSWGPACARNCQNIYLLLKNKKKNKISWESLAKMSCVPDLQPALSVPAIPTKWSTCQMGFLPLAAVIVLLPRTTAEQTLSHSRIPGRDTWERKSGTCSQSAPRVWNYN